MILALSIKAPAQIKSQPFLSDENVRGRMDGTKMKPYNIQSEMTAGEAAIKPRTTEPSSLIQLFDSIYLWHWDSQLVRWKISEKNVNIVYDANHNMISYIGKMANGSIWEWGNSFQFIYTYDANNNQTSQLYQIWSWGAFVNDWKKTYTYDAKNNQTSLLKQGWNGSKWVDSYQYINSYDNNNNWTTEVYKSWNGNSLENNTQYFYSYDAYNNQINVLSQFWNGSIWVNSLQKSFSYDANNSQTSELDQNWNNGVWVNYSKVTNTYDAKNNQTSNLTQLWNVDQWVNNMQYIYGYDDNNNLTSTLWQFWYDGVWKSYSQLTYTYDAKNNPTSKFEKLWKDSIWQNYHYSIYSYDAKNNPTLLFTQIWQVSKWVNNEQTSNIYDQDNFTKIKSYRQWNSTGTEIISGDSTINYFHSVLGINELMPQDQGIIICPNPTNGKFIIRSNSLIRAIEIYNLIGVRIYSDYKFYQQTPIDLSAQVKGIYFAKIQTGMKSFTRKIIVQ